MGINDRESEQNLLNRWEDDKTHTQQSYIYKYPLLNNGAVTGGTQSIATGTSGTLIGTAYFTAESGWAYILHTLTHGLVQSGTFGTVQTDNVLIDDVLLGTNGAVTFSTLFGEDLTMVNRLGFAYTVNTGTGIVGTYGITNEITGWRFKTVD